MPRNPSTGVYTLPPGTSGTPNQPISSTMFNTFVGDIAQDLNNARPISSGGTGATNASTARTNLGVAIGTNVQAYDALLQSISGLTTSANQMIYLTGTDTAAVTTITTYGRSLIDDADAATARTTLGLGTSSTVNTGTSGATVPLLNGANTWSGTQAYSTGINFGASVVTTLSDVSRHISLHTSGGGYGFSVSSGALNIVGNTFNFVAAGGTTAVASVSSSGGITAGSLSLGTALAVANGGTGATTAAAARTALGLGSLATLSSVNNANWSGTDLAVANGGTGASDAATARSNLGLAIGSNVQAYDAGLNAIAGLAVTNGNFIVGNGSTWVAESGATARASLGLGSLATASSINDGNWSGTDLAIANGGTGASSASAARTNLGLGQLATLNFSDLVYSGSSTTNTSYPIGTTIVANTGTSLNRNEARTIYLAASDDSFTINSGGSVLTGTWRSRGNMFNNNTHLLERTA